MAEYDPAIIQAHAEGLYSRARLVHGAATLAGVVAGLVYLSEWTSRDDRQSLTPWLISAAVVAAGWLAGSGAAFGMRLQAQLVLCQLQVEINTRPPDDEEDDP